MTEHEDQGSHQMTDVTLESTITCPRCGFAKTETMLLDS